MYNGRNVFNDKIERVAEGYGSGTPSSCSGISAFLRDAPDEQADDNRNEDDDQILLDYVLRGSNLSVSPRTRAIGCHLLVVAVCPPTVVRKRTQP